MELLIILLSEDPLITEYSLFRIFLDLNLIFELEPPIAVLPDPLSNKILTSFTLSSIICKCACGFVILPFAKPK